MKGLLLRRVLSRLSLSLLCACACLAVGVSAQEVQTGPPRARKIDAFGRLHGCAAGARADNFAVELQSNPGAKGYVVARDSRERLTGVAHAYAEYLVGYFVNARGLDESRFVVLDGPRVAGEEFSIEFWLVPEGAEPPRVKPPEKDAPAFAGKYAEQSVYDDLSFYEMNDAVDAAAFRSGFVFAAYAELLRKQPDSRGYVVVYSPPGAAPGYWRRVGTREQQKLTSDNDPPADRVTVIHGGALPAKEKAEGEDENWEDSPGRIELWVGPKDGPPPVKHVEEETRFDEAVMVSTSTFYGEEGEQKTAAWVLGNLVEMLRADEHSIACFVIYGGDGSGLQTGEEGVEEPAPDVFKLAEKWKAALLKKHGLAAHRVVLINGPQEEGSVGKIEAWAVPPGAALPDPFANAEEESAEEEEEGPAEGGEEGGEQKPPTPPGGREE